MPGLPASIVGGPKSQGLRIVVAAGADQLHTEHLARLTDPLTSCPLHPLVALEAPSIWARLGLLRPEEANGPAKGEAASDMLTNERLFPAAMFCTRNDT